MTDYTALIARLRDLHERFVFQGGSPYANALADALEAQARRITDLDERLTDAIAKHGGAARKLAEAERFKDGLVFEQRRHTETLARLAEAEREVMEAREAEDYAKTAWHEAERDAARYRWLRERMEVRPQQAISGSTRDAISVRIGCSFLDSEVSKRRSLSDPDAHENGCKKFDAALDAAMKEGGE